MNSSKVCIIIPTSESEKDILQANGGHKKVISLQIMFLRNINVSVNVLPILNQPGIFPKLLKFLKKRGHGIQRLKNKKNSNFFENINWILLIFFRIILYYIQEIDHRFISSINNQINKFYNQFERIVIFNNLGEINPKILPDKNLKILVKHDIQSKLFSYLIDWKIAKKIITVSANFLERKLIKNSDFIIALNNSDSKFFKKMHPNVDVWIPVMFKNLKETRKQKKDKFIVGFLGSNWSINIIAANKILEIASRLVNHPNIEFWIIGTVGSAINKINIPNNVKVFGWVENLDECLSKCDIFLNPKIGIFSGLEIKALDYLQYNKPIIANTYGATGLPLSNKNSIIDDNLSKWPEHILFLTRNPKVVENKVKQLKEDKIKFQKKMFTTINKILYEGNF